MTLDDVSSSVSARGRRVLSHRRVKEMQKPRWRVVARATSYDHQILMPSRSVDEKAMWAARVPRRRSGSEKSEAARERLSEATCGAWRRVACFRLTGFLGFPRGMLRSTSVGSVSTSEGLMCTDLMGRDTDCLGFRNWTQ